MKQIIVPIVIIAALIAFFVIVDRKEFSRHDDVQTVQSESTTSNKKPLVSVPEIKSENELKPAGKTNLVANNKPVVETKSVAESKVSTDPKPMESMTDSVAEASPFEGDTSTKNVTETKKLMPTAVPVVNAEEAEKLNEEAKEYVLEEMEKREPFYILYQNTELETVRFQGTIRATSTIPDPKKNDYDNCLYALFVEIESLFSDVKSDTKIACEVIVNAPIMKDKTILQDNIFLPGDKVWCTCSEKDIMPQSIQEIQLSDDIQSYEHQQYYSLEIRKISSFQKGGNRNFAKREITILPIQSLPAEEKAVKARRERIQRELERINQEIYKHGGSFEAWKEEYKTISAKYEKLCGEQYKGWIHDSFFAAHPGEPRYKTQEYIDGILPYKSYLEKNNIDLLIVRIPTKGEFARCVLASDVFQESPNWMEHYYECLKHDIEVVDPMREMWEHRFDYPLFYFYNTPTEFHPFEGQAFSTAVVLSKIVNRYSVPASKIKIELEDYVFQTSQPRYFYPEGNPKFDPKKNLSFYRVVQNGRTIGPLVTNSGSPILFLSNSYFWYPQRNEGASVPAYTAFLIQHIPDWFYQDGIGNEMLRNLLSDSSALSNRKVIIMVVHPNDWYDSFPPFPKYLVDKPRSISLEKTLEFYSPDVKIIDNGSFLFTQNEDGSTSFTQNTEKEDAGKTFHIEIQVPGKLDKNMCMLRINFGTNSYITMNVRDKQIDERIDSTTLAPGTNLHTDFFIPISSDPREISIEFSLAFPERKYSFNNIEFWYY